MNKSILITTPGRCGSHWLMGILSSLLDLKPVMTKEFDANDFVGSISTAHNLSGIPATVEDPFCHDIKHTCGLRPFDQDINIIILVRDPRDICVSMLHYMRHKHGKEVRLEDYLEQGLPSPVFFEAYKTERDNLRHYLIRFEDLILHPRRVIDNILTYFGYAHESKKLNDCIDKNVFNNLQAIDSVHYRKGVIGDWKNCITPEQNDIYCEKHAEIMRVFDYDI